MHPTFFIQVAKVRARELEGQAAGRPTDPRRRRLLVGHREASRRRTHPRRRRLLVRTGR